METTHRTTQSPEAIHSPAAAASGRAGGQSWMVWLRARAGEELTPRRAGLEPEREAIALGRCLLVLPNDGDPYSWCRRGRQVALLYGHLLNREDLLQRLELPQKPAPSDAELLLAAYQAWGADAAGKLDGAFSAVVWDEASDLLLAIRDAIGLKPLFYARHGSDLILSSDVWTILQHPEVSREVNRLAVAEHMLWNHPVIEETFFTQVRRFAPAHRLLAHGSDVSLARYWDPCPEGRSIDWLEREDLDRFPDLVHRTVKSIMAIGPTAISLSAGIDSVSVAAFAAEVARENQWPTPHALSLYPGVSSEPIWDESAGQTEVARALGMPFGLFTRAEALGGRPLLEAAMDLSPRYPSPLGNMWECSNIFLMQEARRRGIQVLLTGTGGDEWLCVTPLLAADLIRSGDFEGLWHLYRSLLRSNHLSPFLFGRNLLWSFGLRPIIKDTVLRHFPGWAARYSQPVRLPDWLAPDRELRGRLCAQFQPAPSPPAGKSIYLRDLNRILQHWMVTWELEEFYYRSHGQGITYFHPFFTRPIAEFLLRVPPRLLNLDGRSKGFVRRMLVERFPTLGFEHHKKMIDRSGYFAQAITEQWAGIWQRYAAGSALARAGIVDAQRFEADMASIPEGNARMGYVAQWLSTEAWLRAHL